MFAIGILVLVHVFIALFFMTAFGGYTVGSLATDWRQYTLTDNDWHRLQLHEQTLEQAES